MTSPKQLEDRVAALEQAVSQMRASQESMAGAFGQAVGRLTRAEEALANARPRLEGLEAAAQGFDSRVAELEAGLTGTDGAVNHHQERLAALEGAVAALTDTVSRLGQVARPGRTVIRERLDDLQTTVQEILDRLPEPPAEGMQR